MQPPPRTRTPPPNRERPRHERGTQLQGRHRNHPQSGQPQKTGERKRPREGERCAGGRWGE
eukprot:8650742-Alexandrium_andersonii.AAC.1